ncbi:hypothetical protein L1987_39157 [Smallanthus sonchifolius]|uniref:Uncharacterized protein n=1 Tax=Smallanthus sonchifolius TaxID=185202 RepID=A0ACB9HMF3_9ASTR|nr:hypothetical protein L1987_39157 [Smallanthus sonchifolius]
MVIKQRKEGVSSISLILQGLKQLPSMETGVMTYKKTNIFNNLFSFTSSRNLDVSFGCRSRFHTWSAFDSASEAFSENLKQPTGDRLTTSNPRVVELCMMHQENEFRLKGTKNDNNSVSLTMRIADPSGRVKNIDFLFYLKTKTALSVAREMVEHLELAKNDVPFIAELINNSVTRILPINNSVTRILLSRQLSDKSIPTKRDAPTNIPELRRCASVVASDFRDLK